MQKNVIPLVRCLFFFFYTDDESENFELPDDEDPAVKSNHSEDVGDVYLFPTSSPTNEELDPICVVCQQEEEERKDKKREKKKLKKEGKQSRKTTKGQIKVGSNNYTCTIDKSQ